MQVLKTQRLLLRNLMPADAKMMHAYRNDPACSRYQRWDDTSLEAVRALIDTHREDCFPSEKEAQRFALCLHSGQLIGELAFFFNPEDHCVTLGITVAPEFQRRGYAREMLCAVVNATRDAFSVMDIVALIDRDNTASIRLFESLGFVQECYAESIASYVYVIYAK